MEREHADFLKEVGQKYVIIGLKVLQKACKGGAGWFAVDRVGDADEDLGVFSRDLTEVVRRVL